MEAIALASSTREPWNKGKLVGQKTPFRLKDIWAIRVHLQIACRCRDLALFNLAIDSKLRACGLMQLRVPAYSRLKSEDFLFPSRIHASPHLSTRQRARRVRVTLVKVAHLPCNAVGIRLLFVVAHHGTRSKIKTPHRIFP
jgi:hypothetical protein